MLPTYYHSKGISLWVIPDQGPADEDEVGTEPPTQLPGVVGPPHKHTGGQDRLSLSRTQSCQTCLYCSKVSLILLPANPANPTNLTNITLYIFPVLESPWFHFCWEQCVVMVILVCQSSCCIWNIWDMLLTSIWLIVIMKPYPQVQSLQIAINQVLLSSPAWLSVSNFTRVNKQKFTTLVSSSTRGLL